MGSIGLFTGLTVVAVWLFWRVAAKEIDKFD